MKKVTKFNNLSHEDQSTDSEISFDLRENLRRDACPSWTKSETSRSNEDTEMKEAESAGSDAEEDIVSQASTTQRLLSFALRDERLLEDGDEELWITTSGIDTVPPGSDQQTPTPFKILSLNLRVAIAYELFEMLHANGKLLNQPNSDFDKTSILLVFSCDPYYRGGVFEVVVQGYGDDAAVCHKYLSNLLSLILSPAHHLCGVLEGWEEKHIQAMRNTHLLRSLQSEYDAVALFYCQQLHATHSNTLASCVTAQLSNVYPVNLYSSESDINVYVEVAGLTASGSVGLRDMLQRLTPRRTRWNLPLQLHSSIAGVSSGNEAVHIQVDHSRDDDVHAPATVWGFDDSPDQALQCVLSVVPTKSFPISTPISKLKSEEDSHVSQLTLDMPIHENSPRDSDYGSPASEPPLTYKLPKSDFHEAMTLPPGLCGLSNDAPASPSVTSLSFEKSPAFSRGGQSNWTDSTAPPSQAPPPTPPPPPPKESVARKDKKGIPPLASKLILVDKLPRNCSYHFQDREAGIFYQAFEEQFSKSLNKMFNVHCAYLEVSEKNGKANRSGGKSSSSNGSERSKSLKLDIFSHGNKDCYQASEYLANTLCASHLQRVIMFFPRTSERTYMRLSKAKKQMHDMTRALRREDTKRKCEADPHLSMETVVLNPMVDSGFVNVRFKPPAPYPNGVHKVDFPCDVNVTICGPCDTEEQKGIMRKCLEIFENVPSEYVVGEMEISSSNPLARDVTLKVAREQFASKYGLVNIRLDEQAKPSLGSLSTSTGVSSGIAGTVRIWAYDSRSLDRVLDLLEEGERVALRAVNAASSAREAHICEDPYANQPPQPFSPDAPEPDPTMLAAFLEKPSSAFPPSFAQRLQSSEVEKAIASGNNLQFVVRWPNKSCRFIFLEEKAKRSLNSLIAGYRDRGVKITTPYRDKKDNSACMLIESTLDTQGELQRLVWRAYVAVNEYMKRSSSQIICVCVSLPPNLWMLLNRDELSTLKNLQGLHGVHIILEPLDIDLRECTFHMDLNTYPGNIHESSAIAKASPANSFDIDSLFLSKSTGTAISKLGNTPSTRNADVQLSFRRRNKATNCLVLVEVVRDEVGNWMTYHAQAIILILDTSANESLNSEEIAVLNAGKALVDKDPNLSQVIVRVRPARGFSRGAQENALQTAISTGFLTCELEDIKSVVLTIPSRYNSLLEKLDLQDVKSSTAASVLHFARDTAHQVSRIICLEDSCLEQFQATELGAPVFADTLLRLIIQDAALDASSGIDISPLQILHSDVQLSELDSTAIMNAGASQRKDDEVSHHNAWPSCPITFRDMSRIDNASADGKFTNRERLIVLKGLRNNLLNTLNAIWGLKRRTEQNLKPC